MLAFIKVCVDEVDGTLGFIKYVVGQVGEKMYSPEACTEASRRKTGIIHFSPILHVFGSRFSNLLQVIFSGFLMFL